MNKHLGTLAIATASLVWCATGTIVGVASPSPMWTGHSSSGTKPDCSTDANGKTKKDCDKISADRMSTKAKPSAKTAAVSTSSSTSAVASTSSTTTAAASSSNTATAAPASASDTKSDSKKDADKVSDERMSTRGLKPPAKDAKPAPKPAPDTPK